MDGVEQIEDKRFTDATLAVEKFGSILSLPVNKEDPSSITHQLVQLHNAIPAAVLAKETCNYFLTREYGRQVTKLKGEPMNADERTKMIDANCNRYLLYRNWAEGLINECHYQIQILTSLLNYIK